MNGKVTWKLTMLEGRARLGSFRQFSGDFRSVVAQSRSRCERYRAAEAFREPARRRLAQSTLCRRPVDEETQGNQDGHKKHWRLRQLLSSASTVTGVLHSQARTRAVFDASCARCCPTDDDCT